METMTDISKASLSEKTQPRSFRSIFKKDVWLAYLFLLPAVALLLIFIAYPIVQTLWLSLFKVNEFGQTEGFQGLDNYFNLLTSSRFQGAFLNTIIWTVSAVSLTLVISLFLAVVLNTKFPGRTIARAIVLLPWAASLPISTIVWNWIVNPDRGSLNHLLQTLGILNGRFDWLGQVFTAFVIMIWVAIWVSIPFTTVTLLAGLTNIPTDLYEAAAIDGAKPWNSFRFVTLPLLRPVIAVVVVINVIYVFNSFPIVWIMTEGGPAYKTDLLVTYLYKVGFRSQQMGQADAVSVIIFLLLLIFSCIYTALTWKKEEI